MSETANPDNGNIRNQKYRNVGGIEENHFIRGVVPWIVLMPLFSWLGTEHVLFHRFSNIDRLSERLEFGVISKS